MKATELLFYAVLGWVGIGAFGIAVSLGRGRRAEARRHTWWILGVLGAYMVVLLGVSTMQPPRLVPIGADQCFASLCYAVVGVNEVPGLVAGDTSRVIRAAVRVTNHGAEADSDSLVSVYLIDSKGRHWPTLKGVSGNRLTSRIAAGTQILSQPVFQVAKDSTGLELVFTHGRWQPGVLTIGDPDSLAHQPTAVKLGM